MTKKPWEYEDFQYEDFTYEDFTEPEDFTYEDFTYDDYKKSQSVTDAESKLNTHLANKPSAYQSQWKNKLDGLMESILNREKFSYDLNGDALYQQYKDKYIQQGKLAMGDAIGQASAMTGGYGSSYAQSVGQQQYQASLDKLNDIVPKLYQMALDKYTMEGQELYNQYGMVADRENTDYGRYRDTVADWRTDRDYLAGRYESERDFDYSKYNNDRNFAFNQYADDRNFEYGKWADDRTFDYNRYVADRSLAYDQYSADRSLAYDEYATDKNLSYNEYRAAIADEQWQQEFDANEAHNAWLRSQAPIDDPDDPGYDNEGLEDSKIKEMQKFLGIEADGKWGSDSIKAAGNLSAKEAWEAYQAGNLEKFDTPWTAFAGSTYDDAVTFVQQHGVPAAHAAGIMTASEWSRRRSSYQNSGQGGAAVKNYNSYKEYLSAITEYLIEKYN